MVLKKGRVCFHSFLFWIFVFSSNNILLAQSFPLTFIHPNLQDSTKYYLVLNDSALNGFDGLDEVDTSFNSFLDIKGYNYEIDTALGLGTCTNLRSEAKPSPDSSNLDIHFFFRILIDTPLPIPPDPFPRFGIISWDSLVIQEFDTIGGYELVIARMTCQNCYLDGVDNYWFTFYASNILGIWTNSFSNVIILEESFPRSCNPSFTLRLDFEYRKIITSLSDKIVRPDGRIYYSPEKILIYEKKSFLTETLSIYDLRGRRIFHKTFTEPQKYALTHDPAKTIGVLKIESENGIFTRKVFY